jgi:hypothetical protein
VVVVEAEAPDPAAEKEAPSLNKPGVELGAVPLPLGAVVVPPPGTVGNREVVGAGEDEACVPFPAPPKRLAALVVGATVGAVVDDAA